jgi:hypothetical protein
MSKRGEMTPRSVACAICHAAFLTRHSHGKYCSPDCARQGERASWRNYSFRNAEQRKEYRARYYEENRERELQRLRNYQRSEAGKAAARRSDQRQRVKHPERIFARGVVLAALRAGMLKKQPCRKCRAPKAQAHHPDYTKPLDVDWLCRPCHGVEHRAAA